MSDQEKRRLIICTIPLSLFAFMFLSAKGVAGGDGPDMAFYGFPFFWHWNGVNSLSRVVQPINLLLDLSFYLVFIFALLRFSPVGLAIICVKERVFHIFTVIGLLLLGMALIFFLGTETHLYFGSPTSMGGLGEIKEYGLHCVFPDRW